MSHFAELNKDNIVVRVVVGDPNLTDDEALESIKSILGGTWIQTSYNNRIRKNYAGIGMKYDQERDAFIPSKPFDSWLLNEETCQWEPPIPLPLDGIIYRWDEPTKSWIK